MSPIGDCLKYFGLILAAVVGKALVKWGLNAVTRGKYSAPSRITWKGTFLSWALWIETVLKRKPAFKKHSLKALQKAAMKNVRPKGLTDFGGTW